MGAYVSKSECLTTYNITVNCDQELVFSNTSANVVTQIGNIAKGGFEGDPDIAGIGVVGAFVAVTSLALIISFIYVIWEFGKGCMKLRNPEADIHPNPDRFSFSDVLETLVLSCSDQQIFTGGAYALTLRYWKACEISAYHYNILSNMLLLTCGTHLLSITIVTKYWRYPWIALLRVIIMSGVFVVVGLLLSNQNSAELQFPTKIPPADQSTSLMVLPAACFQSNDTKLFKTIQSSFTKEWKDTLLKNTLNNHIEGWNLYLMTLVWYAIALMVLVARVSLKTRERKMPPRPKVKRRISGTFPFIKWIYILFGLYQVIGVIISAVMVVMASNYVLRLRDWMNRSGWIELDHGKNPENDPTSFGQLVPLFLILLTLFAFIQVINEQFYKASRSKKRQWKYYYPGRENGVLVEVLPNLPRLDSISWDDGKFQRPTTSEMLVGSGGRHSKQGSGGDASQQLHDSMDGSTRYESPSSCFQTSPPVPGRLPGSQRKGTGRTSGTGV